MQIAKLFATLGFNVDTKGIDKFEQKLKDLKSKTNSFSSSVNRLNKRLSKLQSTINSLNSTRFRNPFGSGNLGKGLKNLSQRIKDVENASKSLTSIQPQMTSFLDTIRGKTWRGSNAWKDYATNVDKARIELNRLRRSLNSLNPSGRPSPIIIRGAGNRGSGGGSGGLGQAGAMGFLGGLLRPTTAATALAGGAITAGFATKAIVETGRDVQRMQNMVLATSHEQIQGNYEANLDYIKKEANRLGVDMVEFGSQYAKVFASAKRSLKTEDIQKFYTGIAEYSSTLQLDKADQKGVFRALGQMFSKNKIQAEEARQQLGDRLPDALKMLEEAARKAGIKFTTIDDAMKKGILDPAKVIPIFGEMLAKAARNGGALEIALNSSAQAQQEFNNKMKEFAHKIYAGGLDAALRDLFKSLTVLVDVITPLAMKISEFIKYLSVLIRTVNKVTAGNKEWMIWLGATLVALGSYRKIIFLVTSGLNGFSFTLVGVLKVALKVLRGFGGLALALWGVYEVGKALHEQQSGKDNWLSVWQANLGTWISYFDLFVTETQIKLGNLKYDFVHFFDDLSRLSGIKTISGMIDFAKNPNDPNNQVAKDFKERFSSPTSVASSNLVDILSFGNLIKNLVFRPNPDLVREENSRLAQSLGSSQKQQDINIIVDGKKQATATINTNGSVLQTVITSNNR